jgi:hypothetical protein
MRIDGEAPAEKWPASSRNHGRLQMVRAAGFILESLAGFVGISSLLHDDVDPLAGPR